MPMEPVVERVSPHTARMWFEGRRDNRPVNENAWKRYATDMAEGRWHNTGVPLVFNGAGRLMDGQHRLLAVIEYGKPVDFVVVRGVDDAAMEAYDIGLARRLADFLHLRGESYAKQIAATIHYVARYERYGTFQPLMVQQGQTVQQALEFFDSRADELRYAVLFAQTISKHIPVSQSIIASLYVLFAAINEADADDFFDKLGSGVDLAATDAILLFRQRMINNRAARDKIAPHVVAALAIKAWNAYRAGRPVLQLSWHPGGKTPEPFPKPE